MKKIATIISGMALMLGFHACSEETVPLYSGCESGLFIQEIYYTDQYGNPVSFRDSTHMSFAQAKPEIKTGNIRFIVRTMGGIANYDRPYKIQIMEGTTAIEGEDFDLERNDFTVNANQSTDTVIVRCHRTLKLRNTTLRVKIGLLPNEHFQLPIDGYKNSASWEVNGPRNSATSFIVRFDEKYSCPSYWTWFAVPYFGDFTITRFLEINKLMGWTPRGWNNGQVPAGRFDFAARTFQKHLQKLADAGTPLVDDDGKSYVQLPVQYAVDYSGVAAK